jgi:hypothetical protein
VLIISLSSIIAIIIHFLGLKDEEVPIDSTPTEISAPIIDTSTTTRPTANEALAALFAVPVSRNRLKIDESHLASLWFEQSFEDGLHRYHSIFIKTQITEKESGEVYGGHADAPIISAVVYRYQNNRWKLVSKQKNIGVFGSWGNAPDIKQGQLLPLAKGNTALLLNISYSGQGYTNTGKAIYSYYENNWVQVGYLQTGGDNEGVCDDERLDNDELLFACWRFSGNIKLAKDNIGEDYPDLVVHRKGTMSGKKGRIIPVKDSMYIFNGEEYVEVKEDEPV